MPSVAGGVAVDKTLGDGVEALGPVTGCYRLDTRPTRRNQILAGVFTSLLSAISISAPARGSLPSATGIRTLHAE